jgi:hypothetical protein
MQLDLNRDVVDLVNTETNLIRKAHELRRDLQVTIRIRIEFAAIPTRIESADIHTPTSKFNTN